MNIKVAIRVRPFNSREKELGSDLCIQMDPRTTYILDEQGQELHRFSYDHCFWSHDGFHSLPDGYLSQADSSSPYADQKLVYSSLGREILQNSLKGYNCCLFAYGQTGSGKSYSIFGYGPNKGIVPLVCDELLNGDALKQNGVKSKLSISMLEIYNEKVQDLLIPIKKRPSGGLKVRENLKMGVFVEGLKKFEVKTYEEIEEIIEKGNQHKSLGATLMNATSSRAHTIIGLELIQKKQALKKTIQKTSTIFLVDLAGSEKVSKTGAKADRLKEACSINKSLSVLGIVIHQLYKKAIGKKTIVSYRDSVLTRILQNALGGNSKTTMICAISPARDNVEETISTLRYANQAKMIKLNAVINESETDKLIRELTEENKKLKKMLQDLKKTGKVSKQQSDDIENQIKLVEEQIKDSGEFEEDEQLQEQKENFRKKTVRSLIQPKNVLQNQEEEDFSKAIHITNLNEDPMLSKKIVFNMEKKKSI